MKSPNALFILIFSLFIASFFSPNEASGKGNRGGPIAIRNQMPLYLFYLQMPPDKSEVTQRNKFIIDADYTVSNITVSCFTPGSSLYDIQIDTEVSRITLDFRYGLYDNLEVGLELPYISLSSGYLDNFIEGIEDGIGAKTPRSRERQGSYEFDYTFKYNNKYLIKAKHSSQGLGDIVFNTKYLLYKEAGLLPNISLRGALKFPTGDKDDLLGSEEFDYGFGFLIDKVLFDKFTLYTGANIVIIHSPSMFDELDMDKDIYSGMFAIEYFFTRRFSMVTQVSGNSSPYPDSSTNALDNNAGEFGIALNYVWKEKTNISWHIAVFENIKSASSPDVSMDTSIRWKF